MKEEIINELEWDSTHRLVFLTIATIGIYPVFYIRRQSSIFNSYFPSSKISNLFILILLSLIALSAVFTIFSFIGQETIKIAQVNNMLGLASGLMTLFWAFKIRNKLNQILGAEKGHPEYFKKRYTILFNLFYINFKINQLTEQERSAVLASESDV